MIGLPTPAVAGIGLTENVGSSAALSAAFSSGSSVTVLEMVLPVSVLGSGTGSPGFRVTGLPVPSVAGIGLTENPAGSDAGVSGNAPGAEIDFSNSLGTAPANAAVVAPAPTVDMAASVGWMMSDSCSTLFSLPDESRSVGRCELVIQSPSTTNCSLLALF